MSRPKTFPIASASPTSPDADASSKEWADAAHRRGASSPPLLTPRQAADRLGIRTTTLYGWLGLARIGSLVLHGETFALRFLQTGAAGQGRIFLEEAEVERLRERLVVRPRQIFERRPPAAVHVFPGINVPLGRPRS